MYFILLHIAVNWHRLWQIGRTWQYSSIQPTCEKW